MLDILIDRTNRFTCGEECSPYATIPAWWSGFLFHVMNTRQLSLYVYLTMLTNDASVCYPTTKQIQNDLGLSSPTMLFEAIKALERDGFILRRRQTLPALTSRRNIYQRPCCEYTLLRLLENEKVDGMLRPTGAQAQDSDELRDVTRLGLRSMLGSAYEPYEAAPLADIRSVLIASLEAALLGRSG